VARWTAKPAAQKEKELFAALVERRRVHRADRARVLACVHGVVETIDETSHDDVAADAVVVRFGAGPAAHAPASAIVGLKARIASGKNVGGRSSSSIERFARSSAVASTSLAAT